MQTALYVVGIAGIAVFVAAFVVVVAGVLREIRKIGQMSEDLSHFLKTAEEELSSTTRDARTALDDIDQLVVRVTETVGRIDKLAAGTERLVEGAHIAGAAAKAMRSSTAGLVSVYEGVKQGIRTLRGSQETNKEVTTDEQ